MGEGLGDVVTKQSWNSPLSAPALSLSSVTPHGSSLPSSSQISMDPVQPVYLELLPQPPGLHPVVCIKTKCLENLVKI